MQIDYQWTEEVRNFKMQIDYQWTEEVRNCKMQLDLQHMVHSTYIITIAFFEVQDLISHYSLDYPQTEVK